MRHADDFTVNDELIRMIGEHEAELQKQRIKNTSIRNKRKSPRRYILNLPGKSDSLMGRSFADADDAACKRGPHRKMNPLKSAVLKRAQILRRC